MTQKKSKNQNKKRATNTKHKNKHSEPQIRVDFETVSKMSVLNCYDIEKSKKGSVFENAKKNPEYAALIFTIMTTAAYFLIKMIAFLFFAGQCFYHNVELRSIKVDNDPVIITTIVILLLIFLIGALINKFQEFTSKHRILSYILMFIILSVLFFVVIQKSKIEITINYKIISSILCALFILLFVYISSLLENRLLRIINHQIDSKINKMNYSMRLSIISFIILIPIMLVSFVEGYDFARNNKKYKIVDNKYVVLYMSDEIAVCSPYTEDNNCITVNKNIQKYFGLTDIEFETKVFDEVK